jgi:hypothetical protein
LQEQEDNQRQRKPFGSSYDVADQAVETTQENRHVVPPFPFQPWPPIDWKAATPWFHHGYQSKSAGNRNFMGFGRGFSQEFIEDSTDRAFGELPRVPRR